MLEKNDNIKGYNVYWGLEKIARIIITGNSGDKPEEVHYEILPGHFSVIADNFQFIPSIATLPGIPFFFRSFLPEWKFDADEIKTDAEFETFFNSIRNIVNENGSRYLSGISLTDMQADRPPIHDVLNGRLRDFVSKGTFTGKIECLDDISFEALVKISQQGGHSQLPGMNLKLSMYLDKNGTIKPAFNLPATHFAKFRNTRTYAFRGNVANEWYSMLLAAEGGGIRTAECVLCKNKTGETFLVTERFDIPISASDSRKFIVEDMCAIHGMFSSSKNKTSKTVIEIAEAIASTSTNKKEDLDQFYRLIVSSWIIGNGDLHLKNISMITEFDDRNNIVSRRLTPAYDIMSTLAEREPNIILNDDNEIVREDMLSCPKAVLAMDSIRNSKNYTLEDFDELAKRTVGIKKGRQILKQIISNMVCVVEVSLDVLQDITNECDQASSFNKMRDTITNVNDIILRRCTDLIIAL